MKWAKKKWYVTNEALDAEILGRFLTSWNELKSGGLGFWLAYASRACAYIIVADQFPRNMFRGTKKAFESGAAGFSATKSSIKKGWYLKIGEPIHQFFYLPFMHSENLYDQDRCVRLIHERMALSDGANLTHAKAHREVIRQFGRFPYRNHSLKRKCTSVELDYLDRGGYGTTLHQFSNAN